MEFRAADLPLLRRSLRHFIDLSPAGFPDIPPASLAEKQNAAKTVLLKLGLGALDFSLNELAALDAACLYASLTPGFTRQERDVLLRYHVGLGAILLNYMDDDP